MISSDVLQPKLVCDSIQKKKKAFKDLKLFSNVIFHCFLLRLSSDNFKDIVYYT